MQHRLSVVIHGTRWIPIFAIPCWRVLQLLLPASLLRGLRLMYLFPFHLFTVDSTPCNKYLISTILTIIFHNSPIKILPEIFCLHFYLCIPYHELDGTRCHKSDRLFRKYIWMEKGALCGIRMWIHLNCCASPRYCSVMSMI
jgi:hypothetical protein